MTIIAGFNFDRGIMLCADTKHTAAMKLEASKIFSDTYHSEKGIKAQSVICYSGRMRYARMAIRNIEEKLKALETPTIRNMRTEIESVLQDIHDNYLYKHPDWRIGQASLGLLIGLWSEPDQSLQMFSTEDTALMPAPGYDCLGSGEYLAHYLVRNRYEGNHMPLEDVLLLATNMLSSIKDYDDGCGGRSEIIVMTKEGQVSNPIFSDISIREEFNRGFEGAAETLFRGLWKAKNQAEIKDKLSFFAAEIDTVIQQRDTSKQVNDEIIRQVFGEDYIMP